MQSQPIWMEKTLVFHSSIKDTIETGFRGADQFLQSIDKHPDLSLDCNLGKAFSCLSLLAGCL